MKNVVPTADVLEMLFSNRNKAYGAYELRRSYPDHLRKGLLGGLAIPIAIGLLALLAPLFPHSDPMPAQRQVVIGMEKEIKIELEPKKVEIKAENQSAMPKAADKFIAPTPVSEETPTPTPTVLPASALQNSNEIGATTTAGPENGAPSELIETGNGTTSVATTATPVVEPPDAPFEFVEQMPEFGGGEQALLEYMAKHINYPALARETGVKGTVVIRALVDNQGKLRDFKIIRDPGGGCGAETIRVLKAMPNWSPGIQNGRNVKVWVTIPVRFELL